MNHPRRRQGRVKTAARVVVLQCLAGASIPTSAQTSYVGLTVSGSRASFDAADFSAPGRQFLRSTDDRSAGAGLVVGRRFGERWSIELALTDHGRFGDRWTATAGPLYQDIVHTFAYRARSASLSMRWHAPLVAGFEASLRAGIAINQATNRYDEDLSRHIAPPLLPCNPPGSACYPPFSNSPTFAEPGRHRSTRAAASGGVALSYDFGTATGPGTRLGLGHEWPGRFGASGAVGRVDLRAWTLTLSRAW